MTNAEKYLKNGVSIEELVKELCLKFYEKRVANYAQDKITIEEVLTNYFNEEAKPTLTEDERVILRNIDIDNYKGIGRKNDTLYLVSAIPNFFGGEDDKKVFWYCFHELFQFITERRRIRNRGVIK